jgi:hypothetical protein
MSMTHCIGIAALAVVWMNGKPTVGYLARVGPAPLRFQTPARPEDVTVVLPPLAMRDPEPVLEFLGPPMPETPLAPMVLEAASEPALPPPTQGTQVLTPQMLIQFFSGDSTNHDYNVVAPIPFSPPPANISAPPSRATYTKQ